MIFDPTHVIKNIYNNLLTRKMFKLPELPSIVPKALTATSSDIAAVYDEECQKPLQIAHKLSETVLDPKTSAGHRKFFFKSAVRKSAIEFQFS